MKPHPQLLVRDALASCFVAACGGDADACARIEGLARWREGAETEIELHTEDGSALFTGDGALAPPFAALDGYTRDRARRYEAALGWLCESSVLGNPLEAARAAWDAGLFFEVHEILEPVWLEAHGEDRSALQGLIMAGAALHHLTEGNAVGARSLLREAVQRLEGAPKAIPYDLAMFARDLEGLANGIDDGIRDVSGIEELPRLAARASE